MKSSCKQIATIVQYVQIKQLGGKKQKQSVTKRILKLRQAIRETSEKIKRRIQEATGKPEGLTGQDLQK